METNFFDDIAGRLQAEQNNLVVPKDNEGSIRGMMESHLVANIDNHNKEVAAKIHYLQTGEVADSSIQEWTAMVSRSSKHEIAYNIQRIYAQHIDLNYALHNVDDICQFTELGQLSDVQFLEFYNRMLLQLRSMRLPDVTVC